MSKKIKILVVDDIKGWRDYHSLVLKELLVNSEIITAESAKEAYDKLLEHNDSPFDIILTDMQMESDFEPKYAGEWFIEQIKTFKNFSKTKVVAISAAYNLDIIAKVHNVEYIRKSTARNFPQSYEILL